MESLEPAVDGRPPPVEGAVRKPLVVTVRNLALGNAAIAALGFVTAPLQARALGPGGRGQLASVLATYGIVSFVASFALPEYATRASARGAPPRVVARTLGVVLALFGGAGCGAMLLLAPVISGGSPHDFGTFAIAAVWLPLSGIGSLALGLANGSQRWRVLLWGRVGPAVAIAAAVTLFAVLGALTVRTALLISLLGNGLVFLAFLPLLSGPRGRFEPVLALDGIRFGARALPGALASSANLRLDQVVLAPLASVQQLGYYAVAVTTASCTGLAIAALGATIYPRIAAGDNELAKRASRLGVAVAAVMGVGVAAVARLLVTTVFGPDFAPAVDMLYVLLAAGIPLAGSATLAFALRSSGRPGSASIGEILAIGVTVPGLAVLVPSAGGVGAAIVSLVSYSVAFVYLMHAARRAFGGTLRDYTLATRDDLSLLRNVLAR